LKLLAGHGGLSAFLATEIIYAFYQTSNNSLRFHRFMTGFLEMVATRGNVNFWRVTILSNASSTTVLRYMEALMELLIGRGNRKVLFGINLLSLLPYPTTPMNVQ
jgi:hypothetical protein